VFQNLPENGRHINFCIGIFKLRTTNDFSFSRCIKFYLKYATLAPFITHQTTKVVKFLVRHNSFAKCCKYFFSFAINTEAPVSHPQIRISSLQMNLEFLIQDCLKTYEYVPYLADELPSPIQTPQTEAVSFFCSRFFLKWCKVNQMAQ
jgi:hypothetical protein